MKISGQLLKMIIQEEVKKLILKEAEVKSDVEKVSKTVEKSMGFEQKIANINTREELTQFLQFIFSKMDSNKIKPAMAKLALKDILARL
jgi:predicted RNA-binding protein Jag